MKTKSFIMASFLLLAASTLSSNASAQTKSVPSVDIQATATREVTPDELTLSITIRESDYKHKESLLTKQKEMITVLKNCGIDYEEQLTINDMGSAVNYKRFSKTMRPRSQATYYLKLHDTGTMQRVVEQLEAKEISNIDLSSVRYTKSDELKTILGVEAMKKAKAEAEALAGAVGQEIGKAISIRSWMSNNSVQPRLYRTKAMAMDTNEAAYAEEPMATPAVSGMKYTVNVSVEFELK